MSYEYYNETDEYQDPAYEQPDEWSQELQEEEPPQPPQPQYFAVSRTKFIILCLLSLGFYELVWFYRNWRYVRDRDGISISPFWRAFFAPIWYRKLMRDIDEHRDSVVPITDNMAMTLVVAYYVLPALWRLPDPLWLLSWFSWAALLPVVDQIAAINRPCPRQLRLNSQWRPKHIALGLVTGPLLLLGIASTLNVIPSTQVISGSRLWDHNTQFLENAGLLEDGEEVLYFYSDGLLSIEEDGNLLTDSKVVSYWTDMETNEFLVETAYYDDIVAVETDYSNNFTDPTVITVKRSDGTDFILVVSPEENRDVEFVDALEARVY